ncbi:hypothetical protein GCM10008110_18050 [Marinobacter persicus]|nr:hypothetical protein GCM10008110_18050 [Marinobacter persicus]
MAMNQIPQIRRFAMPLQKVATFTAREKRRALKLIKKATARAGDQRLMNPPLRQLPNEIDCLPLTTGKSPGQIHVADMHSQLFPFGEPIN